MELSALEIAVIGFGVVGAGFAGNAAAKVIRTNGGSEREALASSVVVAGLSAAVLPAAAIAGVAITASYAVEYAMSDKAKLSVAIAKAKTLGTMDKVVNGQKPRAKAKAAA